MDRSETVGLQEAADLLGVHYMTAYRYVRLGLLPARKSGTAWRVEVADLERLREGADAAPRGGGRRTPARWDTRLRRRLCAGDEAGSWGVVEAALASGAEPADVYLDVLVPALRSIGEAWASGRIDVADEHRASAIALRIVGRLGPRFARRGRPRGSVVLGAPAGDRHGLPVALVADLVRGAGFTAIDLGADVPAPSFLVAARGAPRLVATSLSVSTPHNEKTVVDTIARLRSSFRGVPVLVGGCAVPDRDVARSLGADGWAADARGAVALLDGVATPSEE